MIQKIFLGIIGLVVLIGLVAYLMTDGAQPTNDLPADDTQDSVVVYPNTLTLGENESGKTVTVAQASVAKPGYIVMYKIADGKPIIVGHSSLLPAGEHTNVSVTIDMEAAAGEILIAALHEDDGDGAFDFPGGDAPLMENGEKVLAVDVVDTPATDGDAALVAPVEAYLEAQAEAAAEESAQVVEVIVRGANYSFSPSTIVVKEGQTVRLTFINDGGLHDFVIDEIEGAQTKQIQSGGQETIEFVATTKGTFSYYCSVGQHRALGMEGTLVVE